jgi:DNA mismatch repair protein MutS
MHFTTDDQTLADLVVFSKPGESSLNTIFNNTLTSGGTALMTEMLRYPLADIQSINKRSTAIKHFAESRQIFPFVTELFDKTAQYLALTDERTRLPTEKPSLVRSIEGFIAEDKDFKLICNGIMALMEIIQTLNGLIGEIERSSRHPLLSEAMKIRSILDGPAFGGILTEQVKSKLAHPKLADYDNTFRFRELGNIEKLLGFIYQLDVYIAVARVAGERGFVFPEATMLDRNVLKIDSFFHPFLKHPVPNSLSITPQNSLIFLTGANMAGKSTFMKALGICIYLAHTGFPVPAAQMEFPVMNGLYTSINLPDKLDIGASHFYEEVLRIKKVAKELNAGRKLFVIFDELFRGTNVKDAYEATIAITEGFARKADSIFVISTHIIEAGEILKQKSLNIGFKYLPTRMNGNTPEYTYTLQDGITADRHGMIIINNEGILDILKTPIDQ